MPRYSSMNTRYTSAIARRKLSMRKRRMGRPRVYLNKRRYNVYHFKRTVFYENVIGVNNLVNYVTAWGFTLGQLPDVSNFSGLYDEYRINKVVYKIIPKFSELVVNTNDSSGQAKLLPQIHSCIDYDDSLSLSQANGLNEVTQYQTHKMTMGNQIHTRVLVPKMELVGDGSAGVPKARQWIDTDNTTALHNGVKVFIPKLLSANASTQLDYDVQITTYLSFRNVL